MANPVRFSASDDGTTLAWIRSGRGPALVKASNWITHLEYDNESPLWRHWVQFLEQNFDYLRFDERGCGLSDRAFENANMDCWVQDIGAVVKASGMGAPFHLLGISQGAATAISYAVAHPEKVSGLILVGAYARGALHRGEPNSHELLSAMCEIFRHGWGQDNPAFKDTYTAGFVPDGSPEKRKWFHELLDKAVTPEAGARLLMARGDVNVEPILAQVSVPTLIIHIRDDNITPLDEAKRLARGIPGAQLVILEGRSHIIQDGEPAWDDIRKLISEFCGTATGTGAENGLTPREQSVLQLIRTAKSNKEIARQLGVSEKTVRNHASNLFVKIGVSSRQEAIVKLTGKP